MLHYLHISYRAAQDICSLTPDNKHYVKCSSADVPICQEDAAHPCALVVSYLFPPSGDLSNRATAATKAVASSVPRLASYLPPY